MRGREQRNWIDALLIGIASACAVFSGGQAVGSDVVCYLALSLVTLGTIVSSIVAWRFQGTRFVRVDAILFVVFGIGAYFGSRYLNLIFEEDTFPRELLPSSWLIWLLIFGSFVTWRDTTLLFQAIPALALFGFVGCYDTFRPVVFFFFAYLVCIATLFARAHARDMAERAELSGYFGNDVAAIKAGHGLTVALRKGPWRWVAGPEWALGSALAIVALSFLGAPAVRQGVKPISGIARVIGPRQNRATQNAPLTAGGQTQPQSQTRIARGPVRLRNTPAFDVVGAQGLYFRTDSFDAYARGGWNKRWTWTDPQGSRVSPPRQPQPNGGRTRPLIYTITGQEPYRATNVDLGRAPGKPAAARLGVLIRISARNETVSLPIPGEYLKTGDTTVQPLRDLGGTAVLYRPTAYDDLPFYYSPALAPDPNARSGRGVQNPGKPEAQDPALATATAPPRLIEFARRAAGTGPDGIRAERLRAAIASRIAYNINASAAEPGVDPVERALFDTREGYCDVFASSMVLGARAIGIPARYTVGFLGDARLASSDGRLTLLDSDAHAWAELYFEGLGWVPFDATAGARVVPNGGRRDGDDTIPWYRQAWVPTAINIGIGAFVVLGAGLLLWPRRRDAKATLRGRDEIVDRFVRNLARTTRRDRRLDESLVGYVGVIGDRLGPAGPTATEIARDLERSLYGPEEPTVASNAELARRVHSFKGELKRVPKPR